jgi:hypothetical protein
VARRHGAHALPPPQVIRNIKAYLQESRASKQKTIIKQHQQHQSTKTLKKGRKNHKTVKLTRIPNDTLINTKKTSATSKHKNFKEEKKKS